MKSKFSRFLHYTLSHSDVREVFTSSLSLSDLIGESRSNQVANLSHLDYRVKPDNDNIGVDTPVKPECDSVCAGRSMVEMLGVLAIIGVLSIGAIAGVKATNSASFTSPVLTDTTINQITKSDIYDYCALCKSGPFCRVSTNFNFD